MRQPDGEVQEDLVPLLLINEIICVSVLTSLATSPWPGLLLSERQTGYLVLPIQSYPSEYSIFGCVYSRAPLDITLPLHTQHFRTFCRRGSD